MFLLFAERGLRASTGSHGSTASNCLMLQMFHFHPVPSTKISAVGNSRRVALRHGAIYAAWHVWEVLGRGSSEDERTRRHKVDTVRERSKLKGILQFDPLDVVMAPTIRFFKRPLFFKQSRVWHCSQHHRRCQEDCRSSGKADGATGGFAKNFGFPRGSEKRGAQ